MGRNYLFLASFDRIRYAAAAPSSARAPLVRASLFPPAAGLPSLLRGPRSSPAMARGSLLSCVGLAPPQLRCGNRSYPVVWAYLLFGARPSLLPGRWCSLPPPRRGGPPFSLAAARGRWCLSLPRGPPFFPQPHDAPLCHDALPPRRPCGPSFSRRDPGRRDLIGAAASSDVLCVG